jgi:Flp pilus assembly protein TadG
MAVAVAILLPVLKFVAVGALDFTDATADRSRLQGIADASALAGAAQLAIDTFLHDRRKCRKLSLLTVIRPQ